MSQHFKKISLPKLLVSAKTLNHTGKLAKTADNLIYLKIDDEFIHCLYPMLVQYDPLIIKPDYFGFDRIGAHITVFYPEETPPKNPIELGKNYNFEILHLFRARLGMKIYYALQVSSKELQHIRSKYNYPNQLLFKNQRVPFHITIGFSEPNAEL